MNAQNEGVLTRLRELQALHAELRLRQVELETCIETSDDVRVRSLQKVIAGLMQRVDLVLKALAEEQSNSSTCTRFAGAVHGRKSTN
jgi:hypothetical protein